MSKDEFNVGTYLELVDKVVYLTKTLDDSYREVKRLKEENELYRRQFSKPRWYNQVKKIKSLWGSQ